MPSLVLYSFSPGERDFCFLAEYAAILYESLYVFQSRRAGFLFSGCHSLPFILPRPTSGFNCQASVTHLRPVRDRFVTVATQITRIIPLATTSPTPKTGGGRRQTANFVLKNGRFSSANGNLWGVPCAGWRPPQKGADPRGVVARKGRARRATCIAICRDKYSRVGVARQRCSCSTQSGPRCGRCGHAPPFST